MTDELYHWCHLASGDKRTCGYIESRGARVGAIVELVDYEGALWEVLRVDAGVPKQEVRANAKRFKAFQESLRGGGIDQ